MVFDSTLVLVSLAVLFAGYVKGATGMGFPLIATPMLALILDIRMVIVILVLPGVLMDLGQLFRNGIPAATVRRFASMFFFALVGVFLGTWELATLELWKLKLVLGVVVTAFVLLNFLRFDLRTSRRAETVLSPVMGFIGGFMLGMSNAMGPPMAVYLHSLDLKKTDFVKAICAVFIMAKFWQVVAISTWGMFTFEALKISLLVTVFIMASFYLGLKTQDRVDQRTFNRAILVLLSGVGVTLIYAALA